MALLFESPNGHVIRMPDVAARCNVQLYKMDDGKVDYMAQSAIVTRLMLSAQSNVQFLHTLGNEVYIYVFGDRIGQMSLSGLAFTCACEGAGASAPGAQLMYQWYKDNRVSKRKAPLKISIGTEQIEGFVTSFTEDVVDPGTNLVQWNASLMTLPED